MINVSYFCQKKPQNTVSIPAKAQEKNQLIMSSNPSQNACNIMFSHVFTQRRDSGYLWLNLFNGNLLLSMENVVEVGVELLIELLVTLDYLPIL